MDNTTNIYHQLLYSPNGLDWHPIGSETLNNETMVNFRNVPGSNSGILRLMISDGVKVEYIDRSISLSDLPPILRMSNENLELNALVGSTISNQAIIKDPEGEMQDMKWVIKKDNFVVYEASSKFLTYNLLEPGEYTIEFSAKDQSNNSVSWSSVYQVSPARLISEYLVTEIDAMNGSDQNPLPLINLNTSFLLFAVYIRYFRHKKSTLSQNRAPNSNLES